MGIELKTFNPVVFDDPVYCWQFDAHLPCDLIEGSFKKCKQCKTHYQMNKK